MRTRTLVVLSLALAVAVLPAQGGAARVTAKLTPAQIIGKLNAQRKANGIPGGIKTSADWSSKCKKHDIYMDKNEVLTHYEEKGKPGYTAGGEWAGKNSVISYGSSWADGDVFEEAPIHLAQLLQPRLSKSGAFEYHGLHALWGCVTTWPGFKRADPATDTVFTYPGDGVTGVATHYFAAEGPFTPNEIVGAPDHCGQELFVFASGPILTAGSGDPYHFDIVSATLRPKGKTKVAVKIADGLTKIPAKYGGGELGGYLGPGAGIVIPVRALKPKTTYLASVTIKGNGVTLKDSWSFTTA